MTTSVQSPLSVAPAEIEGHNLLKGKKGVPSTHARGGGTALRSLVLVPTDFGLLCLVFVLWGAPPLFLAAYTLLLVANAVFLAAAAVKWHREIRALDAATPDEPAVPAAGVPAL